MTVGMLTPLARGVGEGLRLARHESKVKLKKTVRDFDTCSQQTVAPRVTAHGYTASAGHKHPRSHHRYHIFVILFS